MPSSEEDLESVDGNGLLLQCKRRLYCHRNVQCDIRFHNLDTSNCTNMEAEITVQKENDDASDFHSWRSVSSPADGV